MPSRNGSVDGEGRREKSSAEPPVNVKEAEEKSRSRSREGSKKRRSRSDNKASASRSRSRSRSRARSSSRSPRPHSRSSRSGSRRRSRPEKRSRSRGRSRSGSQGRARKEENGDGFRLHVADIDEHVRKKDLERVFMRYGPLKEIWLASYAPFYAFVVYRNRFDAQEACEMADGADIGGRRIRVSQARPRHTGPRPRPFDRGDRDRGYRGNFDRGYSRDYDRRSRGSMRAFGLDWLGNVSVT